MRPSTTAHPFTAAATAVLLLAVVGPSGAPAQDKAAEVQERQDAMKKNGDSAKAIAAFVKGEGGSVEDVRAAARNIHEVSGRILELFPEGTEAGVSDSHAKPEIWQNWGAFQQVATGFPEAADGLAQAAEAGERAQIAAAFGEVGRVCTTRHDRYRVPYD
jgi:cytochrome c556